MEFPVNVSAEGNDGEYVVAPYVGAGQNRPATAMPPCSMTAAINALWVGSGKGRRTHLLRAACRHHRSCHYRQRSRLHGRYALSNNTVFSILQDASGNRSIYGINLSGSLFQQQSYIESVQAENFNQAEHFAFNSQFPYMYYSYKDKLYSYNLGTQTLQQTISLPGEGNHDGED